MLGPISFLNAATVLRRRPTLCDQTHPADLFSVPTWRYLDNLGSLLRTSSGVVMEVILDWSFIAVEIIGLEYR